MKSFKYVLIIWIYLGMYTSVYAQIGTLLKDKLKDKVEDKKNDTKDKIKDKVEDKKDKMVDKLFNTRKEFDPSELNYAIALSDNAALFEAEERFSNCKHLLKDATYNTINKEEKLDDYGRAKQCKEAGEMFYGSNRLKSAEKSFLTAKNLLEKNANTSDQLYSDVVADLGLLYHTAGRYREADSLSLSAKKLREQKFGKNHLTYAASLSNISALYKEMGRYAEAEAYINEALSVHGNIPQKDSIPLAIALNNKAILLEMMGRSKEAEPLQLQALELVKDKYGGRSNVYVRMMGNLAVMYQDLLRYDEAEKTYKKALSIREKKLGARHPDCGRLKHNLAGLYLRMGKYNLVEENLKDAASIYKAKFGENHPSYANIAEDLGNYYVMVERYADAEPLLTQSLSIRQSTLGENHPDYADAVENLAILYWKKKDYPKATINYRQALSKYNLQVANNFPAMSENEKTIFWNILQPKFERFHSFAIEASKQDASLLKDMYNVQLDTKALLLNATTKVRQQILNSGSRELISLYNTWVSQKEYLAKIYTFSKAELAEQEINLDSLEKAANVNEKKLSQLSQDFNQGYTKQVINYGQVITALKPTEAALEIIRIRLYTKRFSDTILYAILIAKNPSNNPELVLLENGADLETAGISYYRRAIKNKLKDEDSYNSYWKPIQDKLTGKTHIYVSLDGVYNQLSLNTLRASEKVFLIDLVDVSLVTNTKDILAVSQRKPVIVQTAFLLGNPNYQLGANGANATIKELPGTKVEVESINQVLLSKNCKAQLYTQNEAKEDILKKLNKPNLLHIATHGFFLPDVSNIKSDKIFGIEAEKAKEKPMLRAGLMLTGAERTAQSLNTKEIEGTDNGILTAYEAMSLNLDNTELVALSACETGLGEVKAGEGVYGLQRAFQVAGSKALVMSLWKVADQQTQELMTSFYTKWMTTGKKHESFLTAQKELKAKYPEPYYWGAFVLVGE